VRELENLIERGIILSTQDGWIELHHLFPSLETVTGHVSSIGVSGALQPTTPHDQQRICEQILASGLTLEDIEAMLVATAMGRTSGNVSSAARMLGMTRSQLNYRLRRIGEPSSEAP